MVLSLETRISLEPKSPSGPPVWNLVIWLSSCKKQSGWDGDETPRFFVERVLAELMPELNCIGFGG